MTEARNDDSRAGWLKPSLNWLLIFVPIATAIRFVPALHNDLALFICAGLAIIPMAGIMGEATSALAARMGEGIGGLLNATFGNAAELIIALMALHKGMISVVKASITGSIIGNLLLVLGLSFLVGGAKHPIQQFNRTAVGALVSSLSLAAIALLTPTVFHIAAERTGGWDAVLGQRLSLAIAIVLILTYLCSLFFALRTHSELFAGGHGEEETPKWSKGKAMAMLAGSTVVIALLSEFLVGSVEAARHSMGLSEVFVGVIVVAIVGNAAEHSTAMLVARRNQMDLSLGIAIGSSQQIALLVAPLLVFASYAMGKPMTLEFSFPEVVAVLASVFVVGQICADGESNWLEGAQLVSLYIILGVLFYFLPGE
jgi:Ca2+:H+ antiporter